MSRAPNPRSLLVAAAAVLVLRAAGCENTAAPPVTLDERTNGTVPATNVKRVEARNPLGPLAVDGETVGPVVRWFLDEHVTAATVAEARDGLAALDMRIDTSGDSVIVGVDDPPPSATVTYGADVTLGVPAAIPCRIRDASGAVTVRYLQADVEITDGGPVSVESHSGNVRVEGGRGDVTIEAALPAGGSCVAVTSGGRIDVTIPADASAQVSITAAGGIITVEGLSLTGVTETEHTLTGTLGAGDGEIRLETAAGDVSLRGLAAAAAPARRERPSRSRAPAATSARAATE